MFEESHQQSLANHTQHSKKASLHKVMHISLRLDSPRTIEACMEMGVKVEELKQKFLT